MENKMEEEQNYVKVSYKQSSSTQKTGYDIDVKVSKDNQKEMEALATLALKTARALRDKI